MQAWINKSEEIAAFSVNYWATFPGASQAPGNDTTCWELHLTEIIVHRRGGGVVVGWVLRNGGGGMA